MSLMTKEIHEEQQRWVKVDELRIRQNVVYMYDIDFEDKIKIAIQFDIY